MTEKETKIEMVRIPIFEDGDIKVNEDRANQVGIYAWNVLVPADDGYDIWSWDPDCIDSKKVWYIDITDLEKIVVEYRTATWKIEKS